MTGDLSSCCMAEVTGIQGYDGQFEYWICSKCGQVCSVINQEDPRREK